MRSEADANGMRTISGPYDSSPHWRYVSNGTGDKTLRFNKPFKAPPIVHATPMHGTQALTVTIHSVTTTEVRLLFKNTAGSDFDCGFHVTIRGYI